MIFGTKLFRISPKDMKDLQEVLLALALYNAEWCVYL
jgi:hypothetical protein